MISAGRKHDKKRRMKISLGILFVIILIISISVNIYFIFFNMDSYLQYPEQIYTMESGILLNNLEFRNGKEIEITYDFSNEKYEELINTYNIDKIAGDGTEFERVLRLMNEFAPRLTHKSDYDNNIDMNALDLLDYSLDNPKHGINCRSKAQILNEMCLALGIYSRKVWIHPNSGYDNDCHVVNEIWDSTAEKWIMMDITNNEYWVDEEGTPLSIVQIREKGAKQEFCTPVLPNENLKDLEKLKNRHMADFLYIMKNMTYIEYFAHYSVGEEEDTYLLFPQNLDTDARYFISLQSCEWAPVD